MPEAAARVGQGPPPLRGTFPDAALSLKLCRNYLEEEKKLQGRGCSALPSAPAAGIPAVPGRWVGCEGNRRGRAAASGRAEHPGAAGLDPALPVPAVPDGALAVEGDPEWGPQIPGPGLHMQRSQEPGSLLLSAADPATAPGVAARLCLNAG